jgi:hypothetical protein
MSYVFVLDHNKRPLDPVHPGRARFLLTAGHAAVWRRFPLTIILREVHAKPPAQRLRLKIDPGSKTTGLAVLSDAACVGASTPAVLYIHGIVPLRITAQGRHSRQMCRTNRRGFPDKASKATRVVGGLRTGDIVRAVVPVTSTKAGTYVGRIAIRATGSCNIKTGHDTIQGIHYRYCQPLHRGDGYAYAKGGALPPRA